MDRMSASDDDRRSVAVVVLDTLRKDAFDEVFSWLPGLRFEKARSTANWTVPVHASLFTGYYPGEIGVHAHNTTLDCEQMTVAEALREAGYVTRAYSANVNVTPIFDFDRGFDEFTVSPDIRGVGGDVFDWESFIAEHRDEGPGRYLRALWECTAGDYATVASLRRGLDIKLRDIGVRSTSPEEVGINAAIDFVEGTSFGDDEFAFFNMMEAHGPYAPPEEWRTTGVDVESLTTYNALLATMKGGVAGIDDDILRRAYDDAVRYLSDRYKVLFRRLRESFDLVITLSDHGESFGEHGVYQHAYGLAPELTHVPLVVSGDGLEGRRDDPVSLLDVHATVLDAASVDAETRGRSLLKPPADGREVFSEFHGVTAQNRHKVEAEGRDPDPYDRRLFGLTRPPWTYAYETRDGLTVNGDGDPDELRDRIEAHEDLMSEHDGDNSDVPESVRRQLEDLGYA